MEGESALFQVTTQCTELATTALNQVSGKGRMRLVTLLAVLVVLLV